MSNLKPWFVDSNVLISAVVGIEPSNDAPLRLMQSIASAGLPRPLTAWHCCLEFYAVTTRLPAEYRLTREQALEVLIDGVLRHFDIVDLPAARRLEFLRGLAANRVSGGRVYDSHIAATAIAAGARTLVTDNPAHFSSYSSSGFEVITSVEAVRRF